MVQVVGKGHLNDQTKIIASIFALKVRYFHESQIFQDFLLNNIRIPDNEVTSLSHQFATLCCIQMVNQKHRLVLSVE